MPTLPVRCPRCDADLTVGREHLNRPVECGACGRAFVPVVDPGGREPDYEPPKGKRTGTPVFGILSLILGVGSLPLCCCGGIQLATAGGAVVCGLVGLRSREGRGLAIAGLVLGALALAWQLVVIGFGGWGRGIDWF